MLYTQVLNLMNKMNLPPPFGDPLPPHPILQEASKTGQWRKARKKVVTTNSDDDMDSDDEFSERPHKR